MLVVSLYMLFWPDPGGPDADLPGADKVVHLLVFLALAGTARLRFGPSRAVLGGVLGYAVVSEVVQALLLAERSGDVWDLLADVVGALLGWALARRLTPEPSAR
ncbi:MAG: VanZ family protein [Actinomycetes bacterium]